LPSSTARTAAAATWAHRNGLWLEAELGYVGGKQGAPASAHAPGVRTDPALNIAYTREVRAALSADQAVVDPRKYLARARESAAQVVARTLRVVSGGGVIGAATAPGGGRWSPP
jgi:fructose/tagatose bisphosphate aldolase